MEACQGPVGRCQTGQVWRSELQRKGWEPPEPAILKHAKREEGSWSTGLSLRCKHVFCASGRRE